MGRGGGRGVGRGGEGSRQRGRGESAEGERGEGRGERGEGERAEGEGAEGRARRGGTDVSQLFHRFRFEAPCRHRGRLFAHAKHEKSTLQSQKQA